ncbi:MAG: flagellin [Alphaproteobacteria bacterium]|nr:MAG: flagellin [Alphaproteobacteria bacterium]
MAFSVNTNASALSALQQLTRTNGQLSETQERVNTGLRIRGAKDNAAVFAISQNLRADFEGYNAVKQSLDRSISALDVALSASQAIGDLLLQLKERAVAAADAGLDTASRNALRQDFEEIRNQITTIIQNAEFNGTNLIDGGTDQVVAITTPDALQNITIGHENMSPGGSVITFGPASTFNTASQAQSLVAKIDASIANLSDSQTRLGAGAKALQTQRDFTDVIQDSLEVGIGNLVDADLARESAKLQALQVKQQLGLQALSIANGQPQSILSLFQ